MKNISIIFHSGSYDRVNHGLSIALSTLLMGGKARLYFTHSSLKYLKRGKKSITLPNEDEDYRERYMKSIENGHVERIEDMIKYCKEIGAEFFVCPTSMAILNISRDELIEEVDMAIGLASFISESEESDLIFI